MKINTSHLVGAAIALAAVFFSKLDVQSTPAPVPAERQQWEYKILSSRILGREAVKEWDKSGTYGWELVSITREVNSDLYATFKRPKQ